MQYHSYRTQQGVALPVTLIILLTMLISSIYLLKSTNSTTLTASNLAYDSAQARAVDFALHKGYEWLSKTAKTSRPVLNAHSAANGYNALMVEGQSPRSDAFWQRAVTVNLPPHTVKYVIHRLCSNLGEYDAAGNRCTRTSENPWLTAGTGVPVGESLGRSSPVFPPIPKVHYVITARIDGVRGGNAVNQMVVHIGG